MPKKFNGINQKAASALARKAAAEELKKAKQQKEQEDLQWEDNDKHVVKKQKRKEEKQQKRQYTLEKKAETKNLLEQETGMMKSKSPGGSTLKITRTEIASAKVQQKKRPKLFEPLEENINRLVDEVDARNVTEAIAALSFQQKMPDRNPEKRIKASYKAFEMSRLEELRRENPSLRLNQVKQLVYKEWEKSPQNPLNRVQ